MTDKLIATDGTSSGLSTGAAISDTDYLELQQSTSAPASTVNQQFSAIKTWVKSWITQTDVAWTGLSAAAAAADADTFPTNQGAGNLKQTLAAIKTWYLGFTAVPMASTARGAFVSGRWYMPQGLQMIVGAGIGSANVITAFPFSVNQAITISDLGGRVGTAASNVQFAVYANAPATMRPTGNALGKTSNISAAAPGNISGALDVSVSLVPGTIYWLCANQGSGTTTMSSINNSITAVSAMIGSSSLADVWNAGQAAGIAGVSTTTGATFGTWPDLTSAVYTVVAAATITLIAFKVA